MKTKLPKPVIVLMMMVCVLGLILFLFWLAYPDLSWMLHKDVEGGLTRVMIAIIVLADGFATMDILL